MYKTEVIPYSPKAATMAVRIEAKANEMEKQGYELVTATVTLGAEAILIFKKVSSK